MNKYRRSLSVLCHLKFQVYVLIDFLHLSRLSQIPMNSFFGSVVECHVEFFFFAAVLRGYGAVEGLRTIIASSSDIYD